MSFDKNRYKEIRQFCNEAFRFHPNLAINDQYLLKLIPQFVKDEDYEGAKAIKDFLIKINNQYFPDNKIKRTAIIELPEFKERQPLYGIHISWAKTKEQGI